MENTIDQKLDELLEMMRFVKDNAATQEAVDQRFDEVNVRFEKIDERFEKIDERFEKIDERFEKIDERFDAIDDKLYKIGIELDDIKTELKKLESKTQEDSDSQAREIISLRERVERLERQLKILQPA